MSELLLRLANPNYQINTQKISFDGENIKRAEVLYQDYLNEKSESSDSESSISSEYTVNSFLQKQIHVIPRYMTHIIRIETEPKTNFRFYMGGQLFKVATDDQSKLDFIEIFKRSFNIQEIPYMVFCIEVDDGVAVEITVTGIIKNYEGENDPVAEELANRVSEYNYIDEKHRPNKLIVSGGCVGKRYV